jgi:hypothetical protein
MARRLLALFAAAVTRMDPCEQGLIRRPTRQSTATMGRQARASEPDPRMPLTLNWRVETSLVAVLPRRLSISLMSGQHRDKLRRPRHSSHRGLRQLHLVVRRRARFLRRHGSIHTACHPRTRPRLILKSSRASPNSSNSVIRLSCPTRCSKTGWVSALPSVPRPIRSGTPMIRTVSPTRRKRPPRSLGGCGVRSARKDAQPGQPRGGDGERLPAVVLAMLGGSSTSVEHGVKLRRSRTDLAATRRRQLQRFVRRLFERVPPLPPLVPTAMSRR